MFYMYVLKNQDDDLYIGSTKDLKQRISDHQSGRSESTKVRYGSSYTTKHMFPEWTPVNANTRLSIMDRQNAGLSNVLEILSSKVECWMYCQSSLSPTISLEGIGGDMAIKIYYFGPSPTDFFQRKSDACFRGRLRRFFGPERQNI